MWCGPEFKEHEADALGCEKARCATQHGAAKALRVHRKHPNVKVENFVKSDGRHVDHVLMTSRVANEHIKRAIVARFVTRLAGGKEVG